VCFVYGVGVGVSRGNPRVNLGDLLFSKISRPSPKVDY
jgi:hypothetical protein